ncbi:hypothetical protein ACFL05_00985 [Patescibacteria group bacterium]
MSQGSCTYTVINTGGNNRQINSSASAGNIDRKVKIEIDAINPKINILSWQEVDTF